MPNKRSQLPVLRSIADDCRLVSLLENSFFVLLYVPLMVPWNIFAVAVLISAH